MSPNPVLAAADDAYGNRELIFPKLTAAHVAKSLPYGRVEDFEGGQTIYARGTRCIDFLIVLRGSVLINGTKPSGEEGIITVHEAGEFTGELDLFSRSEALVTARAATQCQVLRIAREHFRAYVAAESDIGNIIMRAAILRRLGLVQHTQVGVTVAGPLGAASTLRLQQFMYRNGYPYRVIDTDSEADATDLLAAFSVTSQDLPVVIHGATVHRNPSLPELADLLGISEYIGQDEVFDVAVVGAGPAGLAAAVYAASEGLKTLVIEGSAPGGQAGTSSRIENYLGFPAGISGLELASRAQTQAQKFGARLVVSRNVARMDCACSPYRLTLEGGAVVQARSVVVATGARYRQLDVPHFLRFAMGGLHYSATAIEARLCEGQVAVVVGGGNSAGQAAVYLAGHAQHVHILVRGSGLAATMSDYLIQRIASTRNITLHPYSEILELHGEHRLTAVTWRSRQGHGCIKVPTANVFIMIGAAPCTEWLGSLLELDDNGFVRTGYPGPGGAVTFESSQPGVFAVGDVRSGSVKRVASGVGEGAVVVSEIHRYLKEAPALAG